MDTEIRFLEQRDIQSLQGHIRHYLRGRDSIARLERGFVAIFDSTQAQGQIVFWYNGKRYRSIYYGVVKVGPHGERVVIPDYIIDPVPYRRNFAFNRRLEKIVFKALEELYRQDNNFDGDAYLKYAKLYSISKKELRRNVEDSPRSTIYGFPGGTIGFLGSMLAYLMQDSLPFHIPKLTIEIEYFRLFENQYIVPLFTIIGGTLHSQLHLWKSLRRERINRKKEILKKTNLESLL